MRWPRGGPVITQRLSPSWPRSGRSDFCWRSTCVRREIEAMLIAVGNGSTYGGGMRICPAARLDDGLFDVTVITRLSRTNW